MGVWMDDESTVITVSQGISRPNGAYTGLNFFGEEIPTVASANKLMDASEKICGADAVLVETDGLPPDTGTISGLVTGGLNGCMDRKTECTTCGLFVLAADEVAEPFSSVAKLCLRTALKMTRAVANNAPNAMSLPLLVLKKFRKLRGVIISL